MPITQAILLEALVMLNSSFETNQVSQSSMGMLGGGCESKYDFGMKAAVEGIKISQNLLIE
jgi:hypothetical protein